MTVSRRRSAFLHPAHAPGCRRGVFEWTLHQVCSPAPSLHHPRSTGLVYGTRTEGRACPRRIRAASTPRRHQQNKRRRDGESLLLLMSGGHGARRIGGQWGGRSKMSDVLPARAAGLVLRPASIRGCALFGACVGRPRSASRRGQNDLPIVIVSASTDQVGSGPSCCPAIIDFDFGPGPRAGAARGRVGFPSSEWAIPLRLYMWASSTRTLQIPRATPCSAAPGEGKGS
ncbi:hypothetical protein C8R45DRAFT_1044645 [Mycena sanguinolenta]|nr:hypothetical protein C8R45DRAFT_1044645 [Mycena sanguinolenta]